MTRYARRRAVNVINLAASVIVTAAGLLLLVWILWTLVSYGFAALSPALFTEMTPPPGEAGGLLNAIVGSLLISGIGTAISTPVGILAGTYLAEFGAGARLAAVIRFINDILLSAPSILIGLFVFEVAVVPVGHFSAWAG